MYQEDDTVILCIKDDGRGFDTTTTTHGVGLINIQTRALLFNGEMHINSSPGNGTEVIVTFQL